MTVYDRTKRIRQLVTDVELNYRDEDQTALRQDLRLLRSEIDDLDKELAK